MQKEERDAKALEIISPTGRQTYLWAKLCTATCKNISCPALARLSSSIAVASKGHVYLFRARLFLERGEPFLL